MKVTIWDLDYYYSKDKINCFNPDAMKISSYHKQKGDQINFVQSDLDINRPYDIYYIFKEKRNTPNPPLDFFMNSTIRWLGAAYRMRRNWKIPDQVLSCRPDYLLYPEHNTKLERAEHVRLFNDNGQMLKNIQNWSNSFTNKKVIETDKNFWWNSQNDILVALNYLTKAKNLTFLEPIEIEKLAYDKLIRDSFLKLNFTPGAQLTWHWVYMKDADVCLEFLKEFKEKYPSVACGTLIVKFSDHIANHWKDNNIAYEDYLLAAKFAVKAKEYKIPIEFAPLRDRLDSPYFFIIEEMREWTQNHFKRSWLEYLSIKYNVAYSLIDGVNDWNKPKKWSPLFRDLLRQTYKQKDFLLAQWGDKKVSALDIPWEVWEEEFKYGI